MSASNGQTAVPPRSNDDDRYFKRPKIGARIPITYTPAQLAAKYDFPTMLAQPPQAPAIGIISLGGGFKPSDIAMAFSASGYAQPAPSVLAVSVDGAKNQPGDAADGENLLDIQVAASAYSYCTGKAANIRMYFAPNTDQGFRDALARAISDGCVVVSISWGGPEKSWGQQAILAFSNVAQTANRPIFAASGDNGSSDGQPGSNVDFPASCPFVIGVGGTRKETDKEVVWNSGRGEGTGGGFSAAFPKPTYQIGNTTNMRMVPDVAANADPQTGYRIIEDGSWVTIGGTSASAPLYAGLAAAICGARMAAGKPTLGFIHDTIYANPAVFTDIDVGNNGQWRAGKGLDPCTGLGVARGDKLLALFLEAAPPPADPPPPAKPTIKNALVAFSDGSTSVLVPAS